MPRSRPIPGRTALFGAIFGCLIATSVSPATIFETSAANAGLALRWPEPAMASLGLAGLAGRQGDAAGRKYLLPMPKPVRRHVTIKAAAPIGYTVYHAGLSPDAAVGSDRSVLIGHWSAGGRFAVTLRLGLAGGLALTLDLPPPPPSRLLPIQAIRPVAYRPPAPDPTPATVPLPGTGWLFAAGLAALGALGRRARRG